MHDAISHHDICVICNFQLRIISSQSILLTFCSFSLLFWTYSTVLKKVNISLAKFASEIYASCEYAKQLDSVLILARKRARISIRKNFSSIANSRYSIRDTSRNLRNLKVDVCTFEIYDIRLENNRKYTVYINLRQKNEKIAK